MVIALSLGMVSAVVVPIVLEAKQQEQECTTALSRARALQAPQATSMYAGEMEHVDFWAEHDNLLSQARLDWGRKHGGLYQWNEEFTERYLDPLIKEAMESKSIRKLKSLVQKSEKEGVYKIQIFNPTFVELLLDELGYQEESLIPMRRPNGMNRHGCILAELGFGDLIQGLSDNLIRPMSHILFPDRVRVADISDEYGFVVQYHPDADVNLAEHADASSVTINVCLLPSEEYSPLFFRHVREIGNAPLEQFEATKVRLDTPGLAVIHLGQHIHGVSNVTSPRSNMVVWLHGDFDYVRVAPYAEEEVTVNQAEWKLKSGWMD